MADIERAQVQLGVGADLSGLEQFLNGLAILPDAVQEIFAQLQASSLGNTEQFRARGELLARAFIQGFQAELAGARVGGADGLAGALTREIFGANQALEAYSANLRLVSSLMEDLRGRQLPALSQPAFSAEAVRGLQAAIGGANTATESLRTLNRELVEVEERLARLRGFSLSTRQQERFLTTESRPEQGTRVLTVAAPVRRALEAAGVPVPDLNSPAVQAMLTSRNGVAGGVNLSASGKNLAAVVEEVARQQSRVLEGEFVRVSQQLLASSRNVPGSALVSTGNFTASSPLTEQQIARMDRLIDQRMARVQRIVDALERTGQLGDLAIDQLGQFQFTRVPSIIPSSTAGRQVISATDVRGFQRDINEQVLTALSARGQASLFGTGAGTSVSPETLRAQLGPAAYEDLVLGRGIGPKQSRALSQEQINLLTNGTPDGNQVERPRLRSGNRIFTPGLLDAVGARGLLESQLPNDALVTPSPREYAERARIARELLNIQRESRQLALSAGGGPSNNLPVVFGYQETMANLLRMRAAANDFSGLPRVNPFPGPGRGGVKIGYGPPSNIDQDALNPFAAYRALGRAGYEALLRQGSIGLPPGSKYNEAYFNESYPLAKYLRGPEKIFAEVSDRSLLQRASNGFTVNRGEIPASAVRVLQMDPRTGQVRELPNPANPFAPPVPPTAEQLRYQRELAAADAANARRRQEADARAAQALAPPPLGRLPVPQFENNLLQSAFTAGRAGAPVAGLGSVLENFGFTRQDFAARGPRGGLTKDIDPAVLAAYEQGTRHSAEEAEFLARRQREVAAALEQQAIAAREAAAAARQIVRTPTGAIPLPAAGVSNLTSLVPVTNNLAASQQADLLRAAERQAINERSLYSQLRSGTPTVAASSIFSLPTGGFGPSFPGAFGGGRSFTLPTGQTIIPPSIPRGVPGQPGPAGPGNQQQVVYNVTTLPGGGGAGTPGGPGGGGFGPGGPLGPGGGLPGAPGGPFGGRSPFANFRQNFQDGLFGKNDGDLAKSLGQTLRFSVLYGAAYSALFQFTQALHQGIQGAIEFEQALVTLSFATGRSAREVTPFANAAARQSANAGLDPNAGVGLAAQAVGLLGLSEAPLAQQRAAALQAQQIATQLARVSGAKDPSLVLTQLTGVSKAFGEPDLAKIGDLSTFIGRTSGTAPAELLSAAAEIGGLAKNAGFSLPETLSLISQLKVSTGQTPNAVAGNLSQIFSRADQGALEKSLRSVGVDTFRTSLRDQIKQLSGLNLNTEQENVIAGEFGRGRSGNAVLNGLRSFDQIESTANRAESSQGTLKRAFDALNETLGGRLAIFLSSLKELFTDLARSGILDVFGALLLTATPLVKALDDIVVAFDSLPHALRDTALAIGILAAVAGSARARAVVGAGASLFGAGASGAGLLGTGAAVTAARGGRFAGAGALGRFLGPLAILAGGFGLADAVGTAASDEGGGFSFGNLLKGAGSGAAIGAGIGALGLPIPVVGEVTTLVGAIGGAIIGGLTTGIAGLFGGKGGGTPTAGALSLADLIGTGTLPAIPRGATSQEDAARAAVGGTTQTDPDDPGNPYYALGLQRDGKTPIVPTARGGINDLLTQGLGLNKNDISSTKPGASLAEQITGVSDAQAKKMKSIADALSSNAKVFQDFNAQEQTVAAAVSELQRLGRSGPTIGKAFLEAAAAAKEAGLLTGDNLSEFISGVQAVASAVGQDTATATGNPFSGAVATRDTIDQAIATAKAAGAKPEELEGLLMYRRTVQDQINQIDSQQKGARGTLLESKLAPDDIAGRLRVRLATLRAQLADTRDPAQQDQINAQINDTNEQIRQNARDTESARKSANVDPESGLDQARDRVRAAKEALAHATVGSKAYYDALKALREAQVGLGTAEEQYANTLRLLGIDRTDPVAVARAAVEAARQKLANDRARGAKPDVIAQDQLELADATTQADAAAFSQRLQDAQTADNLGRISHQAYLNYLQSEHDRLVAIAHRTREQQEELDQVDTLIKAANEQLSGQFNLGDINVPSVFEVRRSIEESTQAAQARPTQGFFGPFKSGAASALSAAVDQRTILITINGNDPNAMRQVLAQYVGPAALATAPTVTPTRI